MIKRMQRLRSNRGFTLIELIVVIAVIGILIAAVAVGLDDKQKTIETYSTTAHDFYSVIQTEFTNLQMFDGPITMTLSKMYTSDDITKIKDNANYAGIMYYPAAKGNYLIKRSDAPTSKANYRDIDNEQSRPKSCEIYIEARSIQGVLKWVRYDETLSGLLAQADGGATNTSKSELCTVLFNDMQQRMDYKDGYYLAKVSYEAPASYDPTSGKSPMAAYRENSIKVVWSSYCKDQFKATTFGSKSGILSNGQICGVYTGTKAVNGGMTIGSPGSSFG